MSYTTWLRKCDRLTAYATEGMMHEDFPDFNWREAFEWGDPPHRAVMGAVSRFLS